MNKYYGAYGPEGALRENRPHLPRKTRVVKKRKGRGRGKKGGRKGKEKRERKEEGKKRRQE